MPPYPWLISQKLDLSSLPARIRALRSIGVPYAAGLEEKAQAQAEAQAKQIAFSLKTGSIESPPDREIIAIIAYLQRLGTDIKSQAQAAAPAAAKP